VTQPTTVPPVPVPGTVLPKPQPDIEVGVSIALPFVTPYRNAWEVLRDEDITVLKLQAMRNTDGQARALYRLITLPIRAALKGATYMPAVNVDGGDDEAKFIEQMFTLPDSGGGMTIPFNRVIAQMLLAVFDGFSAFEMVYHSPDTGPLKNKWTLRKLAHRPSQTVSFLMNDNGDFAGIRQRTLFEGRDIDVPIPAKDVVYWAANEEEKPFYGRSYFQSAYYHWDKKFKLYAIAHIASQRAAVGTRVGKMPKNPNPTEKQKFKQALADLGVAQYIAMPDDFSVESLREAGNFDFLALINHHNSQMSKSVLAAFFDEQQGSGGDASLVDFGRQSDALFLLMLQTIMSEIEDVINTKIIPRFIDWNFGSAKYPKFQFGSLSAEQKNALLDMFKTLSVAGQALTISPEFVHELEKQVAELFGLEIDWEQVEADREAEAEQLASMNAGLTPDMSGLPDGSAGVPGTAAPGAPVAPTPAAPAKAKPLTVPTGVVPDGFELTAPQDDDDVELTRGVPGTGGPKYVRTPAGARTYGVPIGTPITRDIAMRAKQHGVEGKNFGGGTRNPNGPKPKGDDGHKVLGGGPGAKAQSLGGINPEGGSGLDPDDTPKRVFTNAKAPDVLLLQFPDGTIAIRDNTGKTSPRQHFDIHAFIEKGWRVNGGALSAFKQTARAAKEPAHAVAKVTDKAPGKKEG
jgi:hypothetical protein